MTPGLRCKPGDLAIIVASAYPDNLGAIVTVVRAARWQFEGGFSWEIETTGRFLKGTNPVSGRECKRDTLFTLAFDHSLRPLRPEDETVDARAIFGAEEALAW